MSLVKYYIKITLFSTWTCTSLMTFLLFKFSHTIHFDHYLSPLPSPPAPLTSIPIQKHKNKKTTKLKKAKHQTTTTPPSKQSTQKNMESILCLSAVPDHETCWTKVDVIQFVSLEKVHFPFPSRHELQMASCCGVGFCAYTPFSMLGFCLAWVCTGLVHAIMVSGSCCVQLFYLEEICFPWIHPPSTALKTFQPTLPQRSFHFEGSILI